MIDIAPVLERKTLETVATATDLDRQLREDWWDLIKAKYLDVLAASDSTNNTLGRLAIIKDSRFNPKGLYLLSLYVPKRHRRKGMARTLLSGADNYASSIGINSLSLDVGTDNIPAIELYQSQGYKITDTTDLYAMSKTIG